MLRSSQSEIKFKDKITMSSLEATHFNFNSSFVNYHILSKILVKYLFKFSVEKINVSEHIRMFNKNILWLRLDSHFGFILYLF